MKLSFIDEPELEFGRASRHVDIRAGITEFGPLDTESPTAPKTIRLAIVGSSESVDGARRWLGKCQSGIAAKTSRYDKFYKEFPGCSLNRGFRTEVITTDELCREIPQRQISKMISERSGDGLVRNAVDIVAHEIEFIAENANPDVVLFAWPADLVEAIDGPTDTDALPDESTEGLDFHDSLKAAVMPQRIPLQVVRPSTYDPSLTRYQRHRPDRQVTLQDEATRAWNLFTAIYYKAGGVPWRMPRYSTDLETCFVGISFYKTLDASAMETSVAQIFNQRGEGVVLRGGKAKVSKADNRPYLSAGDAKSLLATALTTYKDAHRHMPARVVIHKTSRFHDEENKGFVAALEDSGVELFDFVAIGRSDIKLFRNGTNPPLRGTMLTIDECNHVLYTRGSINYYKMYPGLYVPYPLLIRHVEVAKPIAFVASEILALTKMNWNNTQFDSSEPITVRAARQVSNILKYVPAGSLAEPRYTFYM